MPRLPPSDEEEFSEDEIPARKKSKQIKKVPKLVQEYDSDEGSAQDDEYVVEKILGHQFSRLGELRFEVKWQGYDDPKDHTWEPESNMGGALDVMTEYFEDIGGRPEPSAKGIKRKGRQSGVKEKAESTRKVTKRPKQEREWSPPPGSWEHEVARIDTVEETLNPKEGKREKFAYLEWTNGKKTQHPLRHVYLKCPQKMLLYYESHLVFTTTKVTENKNGGEDLKMKGA